MEETRRPRERELVLAPNEYAYVLDTTKGHINCYVGPNKTSLAQTDQPVVFDEDTKRFRTVELQDAIQLFATAPANWYMVLKNPARGDAHPSAGISNTSPELVVGRKVIVPGPASFPLWPGQMVKVLAGHRLKSNQYLVVRIYDPGEAQLRWRQALGQGEETPDEAAPRFEAGEQHVIRGTEVSFYLPPTGVEVVPDEGRYVQDAVTLQRLEYCILAREDGKKTYLRGERVVFPEPNQRFVEKNGRRVFQAIELSDTVGIYVKVIAPYVDEDGAPHKEGEELFLTGKDRIYFPREEHAVIRYGEHLLHHAIAIPKGEGRYVLDRETGAVTLVEGPRMFLPDPRREVLTRRVLSDRECVLLYPRNDEALAFNRGLRQPDAGAKRLKLVEAAPAAPAVVEPAVIEGDAVDAFSRPSAFVAPRTITLDTKYDGAVSVEVWSGFAVQVVDRKGGRRVVQGPATLLLQYDESLEAVLLSTGTPKSAERLLRTAFLQLAGNKVSDTVELATSDLVRARLTVKYRVSFEGDDPSRWFRVQNYVQLLVDHASSLLKARARRLSIRELRSSVTELVRDTLLGDKPSDGERRGLAFAENGMRVYDVEVLDLEVADPVVEELLAGAQLQAIRRELSLSEKESALVHERRQEEISRALLEEREATRRLELELLRRREEQEQTLKLESERQRKELLEAERERERRDAELLGAVRALCLETELLAHDAELKKKGELQALALRSHEARIEGVVKQAQAFTPHLVEALRRLGDERLLASLSENFGELAAIEGRGILETAQKFLDFMPATMAPSLKLKNGAAALADESEAD